MTLNEITTLIATKLDKQFDEPYKQIIAEKVHYWRSRLIKNSIDKNQRERRFFKQTLYIPMQSENIVPDCIPSPIDCKMSVSTVEIPKPLRANDMLFDYVGAIDGSNPFKEVATGTAAYLMTGKYSKKSILYIYQNDHIKVYKTIPAIMIEGIFDNPEDAAVYTCKPNEVQCDFWNTEYPVSNDVLQLIIQSILTVDENKETQPENKQISLDENRK